MANFLLLVDPDPQRRARCSRQAAARLAPVEGLVAGSASAGDFAAVWAAQPRAPVSAVADEARASIVWGDAIAGPSALRIDAATLARAWSPRAAAVPPPFDGFHAVVRFEVREGLTAGTDLLGLFPLYYASADGVLIAGSSPELFRLHPLFPSRLSPEGLAGILLLHAPFAGRTLLRGIRRLAPGHLLVWRPGGRAEEVRNYAIPTSTRLHRAPFAEHVALLDRTCAEATARHAPPSPCGILLSGGRDSRLLAGYLARQGREVQALTLGQPGDHDARCAVAVARALGFPQTLASIEPEQFPRAAERQARWEHLATGFSNLHMWEAVEPLRALPAHLVTGYLREVREIPRLPASFGAFFPQISRHAIAPERLKKLLLPPTFNGLVEETLQRIEAAYERCSPLEAQRSWRFLLAHDWRVHAGGVPWKLSFGAWPVLPVLDRAVLEVIALLPDSSLADRRAQDAILRTRFPALARLPLDRNSDDTAPLLAPLHHRLTRRLWRRMRALHRRNGVERRYYYRIYDFDSPGWQAVRRRAEPHRERLADLLEMDELARYVPPPGVPARLEHGILDGYGRKLLVGLMLWSREHLP